jgi:hypothetical protein
LGVKEFVKGVYLLVRMKLDPEFVTPIPGCVPRDGLGVELGWYGVVLSPVPS